MDNDEYWEELEKSKKRIQKDRFWYRVEIVLFIVGTVCLMYAAFLAGER